MLQAHIAAGQLLQHHADGGQGVQHAVVGAHHAALLHPDVGHQAAVPEHQLAALALYDVEGLVAGMAVGARKAGMGGGGDGGALLVLTELGAHGVAVPAPGVDHVVIALLDLAGDEIVQHDGLGDAVGGGGAGIEADAEAAVHPRDEADHGVEAGVAASVVDHGGALVVAVEPALGVAHILHGEILLGGSGDDGGDELLVLLLGTKALAAFGDAAPGHGDDPLGHILHADADTAAGRGIAVGKVGAELGGVAVGAVRKGGADLVHIPVDAPEADLVHAQRLSDVLDDLVLPGHAAPHTLLQVAQQDEEEVIVLVAGAEAHVGLQHGKLAHEGLPVHMELFPQHIVGGDAGAVAGHIPDGQVLPGILLEHLKLGDILLDGGIPAGDEALIDGLGRQHGGPGLGGGGHIAQGILGEGDLVFPVGVAVVVGVDDLAVLDHAQGAAHQARFLRDAAQCLVQHRGQHVFTHVFSLLF